MREVLSAVDSYICRRKNSEKEVSSQLSHLNISSQSSELDKIEDQRIDLKCSRAVFRC